MAANNTAQMEPKKREKITTQEELEFLEDFDNYIYQLINNVILSPVIDRKVIAGHIDSLNSLVTRLAKIFGAEKHWLAVNKPVEPIDFEEKLKEYDNLNNEEPNA